MRHVSRTHRVALVWLFDRINLDSKIQIKYIDTKNQLAHVLTNGTEVMSKRTQNDSSVERVTAKSKPMMNLDLQTTWKKHQNTPYWNDIKFAQKKGPNFVKRD